MFPGSKKIIHFLASVRLALILIIAITAVVLYGVIADPGASLANDLTGRLVYTSPFFVALVFILLVNLAFCTIRQAKLLMGEKKGEFSPEKMDSLGTYPVSAGDVLRIIKDVLKAHKYKIKVQEQDCKVMVGGTKNNACKWGSVVFHTGLILLITGVFIDLAIGMTGVFGIIEGRPFEDRHDAYKEIREGVLRPESHGKFKLVLNGISTTYKPAGTDVKADLSLLKDGMEVGREWVDKSNYLAYGINHIYLIQNGYYAAVILKDKNGLERVRELIGLTTIKHGTSEQYTVKSEQFIGGYYSGFLEFYPDYDRAGGKRVFNSYEPKNPALKLQLNRKAGNQTEQVFAGVIGAGDTVTLGDGNSLKFYTFVPWVSFYNKEEPGLALILSGFIVAFGGLVLIYGIRLEKVTLVVYPAENKGMDVKISNRGTRFQDAFRPKFELIRRDLMEMLLKKENMASS